MTGHSKDTLRNDFLVELLSQPTAPFREGPVISSITRKLSSHEVPYFVDPAGNIIVGVDSKEKYSDLVYQESKEPLRLFIAHMDHPGFHGATWKSDTELEITWHGGSPTQHLEGATVWIACRSQPNWLGKGTLTSPKLSESGRALASGTVRLDDPSSLPERGKDPSEFYGGFRFRAPVWQDGELIYTKAADDLVGAFAITSVAIDLWSQAQASQTSKSTPVPFLGLLTRAEEVGFIGALSHLELGWLNDAKRPLLCVSLETSRTLPGAEIGKGPVVRLGDRFTVFNPEALHIFSNLAQRLLPGKHQRRIMDGGSCEATAATVFGLPSIGISVPLGNYHNQSLEGGPDSAPPNGPAPEFVHSEDIQGLIQLCHGLLQPELPWSNPWESKRQDFKRSLKDYQSLLESNP